MFKNTTAQVIIRLSGLQWPVGTAPQSSKPGVSNRKASTNDESRRLCRQNVKKAQTVVKTAARTKPWKIGTKVYILNLDLLTALALIVIRRSGRPQAKQEVPLCKHCDRESFFSLRTRSVIMKIHVRCRNILTFQLRSTMQQNIAAYHSRVTLVPGRQKLHRY